MCLALKLSAKKYAHFGAVRFQFFILSLFLLAIAKRVLVMLLSEQKALFI